MKNTLIILTILVLTNCTHKENNSIIGKEFQKFKQIKALANYTKVSDTVIYENNIEAKHGILHIRKQTNNMVIFKSIIQDSTDNLTYKILDTLVISNLKKSEFISIRYCVTDNNNDENIIAIVDKTDSLRIQNIKKVWKANTTSKKIEKVTNIDKIECFNEWYPD